MKQNKFTPKNISKVVVCYLIGYMIFISIKFLNDTSVFSDETLLFHGLGISAVYVIFGELVRRLKNSTHILRKMYDTKTH
jgi:hypothetical protein